MAPATLFPPPFDAGFDAGWAYLKDGLDTLLVSPRRELSYSHILALATASYNCCNSRRTTTNRGVLGPASESRTSMAAELHHNITKYFAEFAVTVREAADGLEGEPLLRYYAEKWERYETCAKAADRAFCHLNLKWVAHQRQGNNTEILPVYHLALVQWTTQFLLHSQSQVEKLSAALWQLLERKYDIDKVLAEAAKTLVGSFVALGIDERDLGKVTDDVYTKHLETSLVAEAENSFRRRAAAQLASTSVPEYMRQARECLSRVELRAEELLPPKTLQALVARWTDAVVLEHADHLWRHFRTLIFLDKREDLWNLYTLFVGAPGALKPMYRAFADDVERAYLAAAKRVGDGSGSGELDEDPTGVVLEVHRKYDPIIRQCFAHDAYFTANLHSTCRGFFDRDTAKDVSVDRKPELLVRRVDALLRKRRGEEEGDLERALDDIMTLFPYVDDRDLFQRFYAIKLARRLIHGSFVSEGAEAGMLSRLQGACGAEYTRKMQRMLFDMSLSKDLSTQFMAHMRAHGPALDLNPSVTVFGANVWPLPAPADTFNVPDELLATHTSFTSFYRKRHAGRTLRWLWSHSRNDVQATYGGHAYTFVASTYQTAVLLQYNACDTRSYAELLEATALADEPLRQALAPLVKAQVLVEPTPGEYTLNLDFTSPQTRVHLHTQPKFAPAMEGAEARAAAATTRAHALRAAIVRVMKARRTLPSVQLVEALRVDCAGRFPLVVAEVDEAVRKLEEQEYVARGEGDAWVYVA